MSHLGAEWTKLRTVPVNLWLLAVTAAGTVALGATATATVHVDQCPTPAECFVDTTKLSLVGVHLGQLLVVVMATMAVSNEYSTGMIRTTFAAMPRRLLVFAAKATILSGSVLAAATPGVIGSIGVTRPILHRNGFTALLPPAEGLALRAAGGTLYLGLVAVLSLGAAALVRDTAVAITGVIRLIYVLPMLGGFRRLLQRVAG